MPNYNETKIVSALSVGVSDGVCGKYNPVVARKGSWHPT